MIKINPVRWTQRTIESGTDQVIFAVNVPEGSILDSENMDVHAIQMDTPARQTIGTGLVTALHGYLMPIPDIGESNGPDQLWDEIVPKDTALQMYTGGSTVTTGVDTDPTAGGTDPATPDTRPAFEIGDVHLDVTKILGLTGSTLERLYKRVKLHTFADVHSGYHHDGETYVPTDKFNVSLNGSVRADQDSLLAFGFSSPDGLDTDNTWPMLTSQQDWYQLRFVKQVVEQAAVQVLGLSQNADDPFYTAADLLSDYLEWVYEEDAGSFGNGTWQVFTYGSAWLRVEGEINSGGAITGQS